VAFEGGQAPPAPKAWPPFSDEPSGRIPTKGRSMGCPCGQATACPPSRWPGCPTLPFDLAAQPPAWLPSFLSPAFARGPGPLFRDCADAICHHRRLPSRGRRRQLRGGHTRRLRNCASDRLRPVELRQRAVIAAATGRHASCFPIQTSGAILGIACPLWPWCRGGDRTTPETGRHGGRSWLPRWPKPAARAAIKSPRNAVRRHWSKFTGGFGTRVVR
jgi:hypothetical protein